jgi:hypothetical protein
MKSGVSWKVKMGASVVAALITGAIGVMLSNVPTRAANTQAPLKTASGTTCGRVTFTTYYVDAYALSACPRAQVQTAVDCTNTSGFTGYTIGRKSTSSCPYGPVRYRERGAARVRLTPTSNWGPWKYSP